MPLAQRALHHLFPGYPLGGFGDRPFPERCWRWSAGSWFDSMVVIEGNGVRKSGLPRTGLLARNSFRLARIPLPFGSLSSKLSRLGPMPLSVGTKLGMYSVLSQIGAGGMGEVYQAHDSKLGRDVAIKVLREAFAHDFENLRGSS